MAIEPLPPAIPEQVSTPENLTPLENTIGFNHGHYYQPPRKLDIMYDGRVQQVFDITGTEVASVRRDYPMGFNEKLARLTLAPIVKTHEKPDGTTQSALLSSGMYSIDLFGVYADWIRYNMPQGEPGDITSLQEAVRASGLRPVGDTFLHLIMPSLPDQTQRMLQRLGNQVYEEYWGEAPGYSWPGEATISVETLANMYKEGIRGIIVRRSQIDMASLPDEERNAPGYWIATPAGRIMAVAMDDRLSGDVSFHYLHAEGFVRDGQAQYGNYHGKNPGRRAVSDGERFGEHWSAEKGAFAFFEWRDKHLAELVEKGVLQREIAFADMPEATLAKEITSWSCEHGKGRWDGTCICGDVDKLAPNVMQFVLHEKQDLRQKMDLALSLTEGVLDQAYPAEDTTGLKDWRNKFLAWFHTQRKALALGKPITTDNAAGLTDLEKKWFLVEATLLIGSTSCGWFFGDVNSYERQLPRNALTQVANLVLHQFGPETSEDPETFAYTWAAIIPTNRVALKQQYGIPLTEAEKKEILQL